jgi:hypothetical protein
MEDRAETDDQKRNVMNRLLDVWCRNPELRLNQLISNATKRDSYNIEDFELLRQIEDWYKPV